MRKRPRISSSDGLWAATPIDKRICTGSSVEPVRWGRKEAVQERLGDTALGIELSRHLTTVFFEAVHVSNPAISPESFYLEWTRAGQQADRMTPAQQVLCAVMDAWGARYSDAPVVLGVAHDKQATAPRVILPDGTFSPGTQQRLHCGQSRRVACDALVERARRLVDTAGVLRKPSLTGVQALSLYVQLLQLLRETHRGSQKEQDWLEGQTIHSAIADQMRLLGLMWDSKKPIITDEAELPMTLSQLRMKQRRLFWTHVLADSLWSATTGSASKIQEKEVDSAGTWLCKAKDQLPVSSFKALTFFITLYHRVGVAGRRIGLLPRVDTGTILQAGKIVGLERDIRGIWTELDVINKTLSAETTRILDGCDRDELVGFSPLHYLANIRLAVPFLLHLVHGIIVDHRRSSQASQLAAHITSEETVAQEWKALETLRRDSTDKVLQSCRAQVALAETLLPTGTLQTASTLTRVILDCTQFMAETPCNEQGYPCDTPGGEAWTWENKKKAVNICVDALYQIGWAWDDVPAAVERALTTLNSTAPSPADLFIWQAREAQATEQAMLSHFIADMCGGVGEPRAVPAQEHTRMMRMEQELLDGEVLRAVMNFWPTTSVPQLIEASIRANPSILDVGLERHANIRLIIAVEELSASVGSSFAPLAPGAPYPGISLTQTIPDLASPYPAPGLSAIPTTLPPQPTYGSPNPSPYLTAASRAGCTRYAEAWAVWDAGQTIVVGGAGVRAGVGEGDASPAASGVGEEGADAEQGVRGDEGTGLATVAMPYTHGAGWISAVGRELDGGLMSWGGIGGVRTDLFSTS
ncbi:hypothetical protein IAT38_004866 [Cryptococcus sp. DSM 104549]